MYNRMIMHLALHNIILRAQFLWKTRCHHNLKIMKTFYSIWFEEENKSQQQEICWTPSLCKYVQSTNCFSIKIFKRYCVNLKYIFLPKINRMC